MLDLQKKYDTSQISHEDRRQELNRLIAEVDELKTAVNQGELNFRAVKKDYQAATFTFDTCEDGILNVQCTVSVICSDGPGSN